MGTGVQCNDDSACVRFEAKWSTFYPVRRGGGEGELTNQTKNEHRMGQMVECCLHCSTLLISSNDFVVGLQILQKQHNCNHFLRTTD